MRIFDQSPDTALTRRSTPTPLPAQPDPAGEPRPNTLTCLEDRAEFEKLRAAVYQHFAPVDYFDQCVADDLAQEMWCHRRLADIANQSLSYEIEASYDQVSHSHPNIDPVLRTVLAWKDFDKDPACRNALNYRLRSQRATLALSNHISRKKRR